MNDSDKILRIKKVLGEMDWAGFPRSAWDDMYGDVIDALYTIENIIVNDSVNKSSCPTCNKTPMGSKCPNKCDEYH